MHDEKQLNRFGVIHLKGHIYVRVAAAPPARGALPDRRQAAA